MPKPASTLSDTQTPVPDDAHWRAAAEMGARLAAKHWQVPLANIKEIALSDADGPCYLFKVIYTDDSGQRFTGAVHMPKCMMFTSQLSMSALSAGQNGCTDELTVTSATNEDQWPHLARPH
ncbi:MAG: hypothetical protein HY836_09845 [Aquabacterium sp.]|uniref:hypothetical protein n=1 Tax=Aquabacterium sp. TaxID=1872578 RepID=UPI0025C731B7|nr:hypothetical protein [Aquabacterium sp.]MBI5925887.1 hypothetical protein [Aquabacterium sp.]